METSSSSSSPAFDRLRVAVRERPITNDDVANIRVSLRTDEDKLIAFSPGSSEGLMYDCDYFFPSNATQKSIYEAIGAPMVDLVMQGVSSNAVVFGFTETGKTYTLYGDAEETGLIHDTVAELYRRLESQSSAYTADVLMRYWGMDRDAVEDNLREETHGADATEPPAYSVFRDALGRLMIPNLTTVAVPRMEDFVTHLNRGSLHRIQRSYERMARWHGFVQLTITTTDTAEGSHSTVRTMTFVHMKGSDRLGAKGIRGNLLREGSRINVSVTLLGAAVIHSLEYREKRAAHAHAPDAHHTLIRRSQSFFMECKFSRIMSQFVCGHEASFVIGCVTSLQYVSTMDTLESLQLFRRLRCALRPIVLESERGRLLRALRRQEALIGGAAAAEALYHATRGPPLSEAEEKLLRLRERLRETPPPRLAGTVPAEEREEAIRLRCKDRAVPREGEARTHGLRPRIFLDAARTVSYEGQWEDGHFGGFGEWRRPRHLYRGEFRGGRREGEGTLWTRPDGAGKWTRVYEGEWFADKRDGFGTGWDANGEVYVGEWSAGERHGFGKLFLPNGDVVRGEFRGGLLNGRAFLRTASGNWYDGFWANGFREGPGLWCDAHRQQLLRGEWVRGVCKCGTLRDMEAKTHAVPGGFIPRLGLLQPEEVLAMERRRLREARGIITRMEDACVDEDANIEPPLGAFAAAMDSAEWTQSPPSQEESQVSRQSKPTTVLLDGDVEVLDLMGNEGDEIHAWELHVE